VKMVTNHPFKIGGVHWTRFYSENIDANVIMAQNGHFVHWEWTPHKRPKHKRQEIRSRKMCNSFPGSGTIRDQKRAHSTNHLKWAFRSLEVDPTERGQNTSLLTSKKFFFWKLANLLSARKYVHAKCAIRSLRVERSETKNERTLIT